MRHFFSNVSPPRPPETVVNAVASRSLRPCDGHSATSTPAQRPGGPCRSSRHAVSPICTRPTSILQLLGRAEKTQQQGKEKGLTRSRSTIPRKHLFHPQRPMMSALERPRNASCRIGSDHHGLFPRSYSGHCPWAGVSTSSSLLLQYVHSRWICTWPTDRRDDCTPTLDMESHF